MRWPKLLERNDLLAVLQRTKEKQYVTTDSLFEP